MRISNKISLIIFFISIFVFCSCGKAPTIQTFPASELSKLSDVNLCYKYYTSNRGKAFTEKSRNEIESEFKKRGMMTDSDLIMIRDYKVEIGASKWVVFASLGKYRHITKKKATTASNNEQVIETFLFYNIYALAYAGKFVQVEIENGKVSSVTRGSK